MIEKPVNPSKRTVIIAHRRKDQDYWEGYTERLESESDEWVSYFKGLDQIVEVFPTMYEYRVSCYKLLDAWEAKRERERAAAI